MRLMITLQSLLLREITKGDIKIHAEQILRIRKKLNAILAARTGQPVSRIELDTERDNYMTADEALAYGLIDEIVQPKR